EAFIAGYRAEIRALKSRDKMSFAFRQHFSDQFNDLGDFVGSRETMAERILDKANYRASLATAYRDSLHSTLQRDAAHLNFLETLIPMEESVLDFYSTARPSKSSASLRPLQQAISFLRGQSTVYRERVARLKNVLVGLSVISSGNAPESEPE